VLQKARKLPSLQETHQIVWTEAFSYQVLQKARKLPSLQETHQIVWTEAFSYQVLQKARKFPQPAGDTSDCLDRGILIPGVTKGQKVPPACRRHIRLSGLRHSHTWKSLEQRLLSTRRGELCLLPHHSSVGTHNGWIALE